MGEVVGDLLNFDTGIAKASGAHGHINICEKEGSLGGKNVPFPALLFFIREGLELFCIFF